MIVIFTMGSKMVRDLPSGQSDGLVTICSAPSSMITRYTTLGAVEIRLRSNSRSRRSRVISMQQQTEEAAPESETQRHRSLGPRR